MNYIIDGHNLISSIPGLNINMLDDELRLIELLMRFGSSNRGKLEVYFDGAPPGQAGERNFGKVKAHFVPQNQIADDAIRSQLAKLGHSARNWVVVTSDRSVQAAAREAHAGVMPAENFARILISAQVTKPAEGNSKRAEAGESLSEAEVNEWLDVFKQPKKQK